MKHIALVAAAAALVTSCSAQKPWKQAIVAQAGFRQLGDDFEPVDDQFVYGLEYTARPQELAIGLEVGGTLSGSDGEVFLSDGDAISVVDLDLDVFELYAGPRFTFEAGPARPYFAAGISYLDAELDGSTTIGGTPVSASAEDATFGGYVRAGIDFLLAGHVLLGLDLRYLYAVEFEELGYTLDGDALQLTGRVGWSF